MSELGDLLELLHQTHALVDTFEVEYLDRVYRESSSEVAVLDAGDGPPQLSWRGAGPWSEDVVRTRRIWLQRPECLRVEILEGEMLIRLGVRAGSRWWRWDDVAGTTSGGVEPDERGVGRLPSLLAAPLFAVHRLPATLLLEPAGGGERIGRAVVKASGQTRRQPPARGTVTYEFEFDAEHGSLLRCVEFEDGVCVWERTATEVIYGSQIDPACFVFVSPVEDERRSADPAGRGSEGNG